jgi:hypothetical protein
MKLPEHVDHIRKLITSAFDKQLFRLGIGSSRRVELEKLPQDLHARRLRLEEMLENHLGETGSYENAREKLVDELTFTLFNRIAAVKVMEAANLFPPIITKQAEHGDRSFGHKAWLEIRPDMRSEELEGIQEYIVHAFNELGDELPLYSKSYPYALMPDTISLNEIIDAFNGVEKDAQIGTDIWQSDDILGWLYESYNNTKKAIFKESKEKTEFDMVSLQSQVYTPRWVVKFLVENSLGKLYLEMYPGSIIKSRYKIASAPSKQERIPKPLHEIKFIDPACGSGNFLFYAFDFFYELYIEQIENYGADYDEGDIPQLIIENNLYGIDLDDRAVQLAQLGLYIKARKKQRSSSCGMKFNVISSDFFLPDYEVVRHIFEGGNNLDQSQTALIADIWNDLRFAYKFGSLIRLDEKLKTRFSDLISKRERVQPQLFTDRELGIQPKLVQQDLFLEHDIVLERELSARFFSSLKIAVEQYANTEINSFLASKTRDAIIFLELLVTKYDVATANPPYTDDRDFGPELKEFLDSNYQKPMKFNTNLYATFIKRCYEFVGDSGFIAMVHPPTFMYIKSFEDVRKFIIDKTRIKLFVEWGYLGMFNPLARVDSALYILEKSNNENDAVFIKLNHIYETKRYVALFEAFDQHLAGKSHELLYYINQSKLKIIKSWPFIYWISDEFREKFELQPLSDSYDICNGISSGGNNERFYRYWWEVNKKDILNGSNYETYKWATINKGGDFQKWYGNLWLVFKWENNGAELKELKRNYPSIRFSYDYYYFLEGLAFSGSTSKGLSVRYQPPHCIFERSGKSIFSLKPEDQNYYYLLGLLNSKIVYYISDCLNPTVSIQAGDIQRIPFVLPEKSVRTFIEKLSKKNVFITKHIASFNIFESHFTNSPIQENAHHSLKHLIKAFLDSENYLQTIVQINEAIINEKIFEVYDLSDHDKRMVLAKEGKSIGSLPVDAAAKISYLAEENAIKDISLEDIHDFIKALPVREFAAEEREVIESEFASLYQSNNDLEAFCTRHQINPINIWYWFKQSSIIPIQRMHILAMEFLTDMIRETLLQDEDGIIPLVPNAGEKIMLDRIEDKFREKGFTMAQYSSFEAILGRSIAEYLHKYFFAALSDHLNLFPNLPKTPFVWHLSSGPEQGFDCYIIIYKWSRDKLMRLRSVYIEHRERALVNRQSDLAGNNSADAQNEKDKILKQLKEIEAFKRKIDELLSEGYDPVLDDGVGKNIAPLQKKKMIPYEVLNAGQLKTYLNADW